MIDPRARPDDPSTTTVGADRRGGTVAPPSGGAPMPHSGTPSSTGLVGRHGLIPPASAPVPAPAPAAPAYVQPPAGSSDWMKYPPVPRAAKETAKAVTIEATTDIIAGANNFLPVAYGGPCKLGAMIIGIVGYRDPATRSTWLYLTCAVSYGPVANVEQIFVDDAPSPEGMVYESVLGAPGQVALPSLVTAYAQHGKTYGDTMPGTAYVNIKLKAGMPLSNNPRVVVQFNGRTVYDMRTAAIATLPKQSNPTLCLADFIKDTRYGAGKNYDVATFSTCADFNDTPTGSQNEISRKLALTITDKQTVDEWIATLAMYANVELYRVGGIYYASPRRAKASSFIFTGGNVVENSVSIARVSMRSVPTVSIVKYTDTTVTPWSTREGPVARIPGTPDGAIRESSITMPGITRATQAGREALERLNWNAYGNTAYSWMGFDDSASVRKGDVVTFSHPVGVVNKLVWINNADDKGFGRYQFSGTSYDAQIFSGTPAAGLTPVDASVYVPGLVPLVIESVTGIEELYQTQNGDWASRVRFEWTTSGDDVSFDHYTLAINDITNSAAPFQVDSRDTTLPSVVTYALQEGRIYKLYVQAMSVLGIPGPIVESNAVTVLGKLAPPGNVPGFAGNEAGGTVYLRWQRAVDIDIARYEVRRGTVGSTWEAKSLAIVVDALGVILPSQPPGSQEYAVKAIDSVGNYSPAQTILPLDVTLDTGSVLLSHVFTTYTPTNMQLNVDGAYYTINPTGLWADGADVPDNAVGTFNDSLKDNLIGFPTNAAASSLLTEVYDFGSIVQGRWTFSGTTHVVDSLAGAPFNDSLITRAVEYSTDNSVWNVGVSGNQFDARYIRLRASCPTGYVMMAMQNFVVSFSTVLREERGTITVTSTGTGTVILSNKYSRWVTIQLTGQGNTVSTCSFDNVIVGAGVTNKFDVWNFTNAAVPKAGTIGWLFQGLN